MAFDGFVGGEKTYTYNEAIPANIYITQVAFRMVAVKNQLEETYPEIQNKARGRRNNKTVNSLFLGFRSSFRHLVALTQAQVLKTKPTDENKKLLKDIGDKINLPYGSYNIFELSKLGGMYFDTLVQKGIVRPVMSWEGESGYSQMMKG